ncbi:RsmB/NOP family class I SAM-dependent RNA methyltransferase [Candidatus Gracilibacteria bacterium]|nr:RsmB/NOP family class I SAM-dependent RNA methyltransferase [Candidatus Gracilibacteria bacterium]
MKNKLPKELIDRLNEIYTKNELEIIKKGFEIKKRKPTFRINTLKTNTKEVLDILKEKKLEVEKINFLKNGYKLINGNEKDLWDLDIYKNGKIYIQSISSQIPIDFLDLEDFNKVLDITAAPGGKTSQASALLKNTGEVIANDNNSIRIDKLNYTISKQGCKNVKIIKTDARKIYEKYLADDGESNKYDNYFNHIIADLPCSSEGKINLNSEKSYGYWNLGVIKRNFKLQKEILKSIIPMLKRGGTLMYSTCTLAPEENEAVVHMILSLYPELEIQDININYKYIKKGLKGFGKHVYRRDVQKSIRILPNEESEGFFIAKFKKIK